MRTIAIPFLDLINNKRKNIDTLADNRKVKIYCGRANCYRGSEAWKEN